LNQSTWTSPPPPESDIGRLNSALREPPSYVPTPVPPSDDMRRPARSGTFDRLLHIPSEKPILTRVLIASFVIIYLIASFSDQIAQFIYRWGPIERFPILNGQWWRLVTGTFLHDPTSPLHVAVNSFSLFMVGSDIEAFFGKVRYAAIYLVAMLGGSVASFIFQPPFSQGVGASGAIYGVFGALIVYYALNRSLFGRFGTLNFRLAIIFLIGNLLLGYGLNLTDIAAIGNEAHIGGLLAGAAVGFVLCPRYILGRWRNPVVREAEDINTGPLPWVATALVALIIIAVFVVGILYFRS
jgi:rhomboid protease GluP